MTDEMLTQLAAMVGCAPDELRGALYGMVYRHRKLMENKYIEDHPCIESHPYRERSEYCSQCNREVCGECSEDLAHTGEGDPPLICGRQACIDAYEAAQSENRIRHILRDDSDYSLCGECHRGIGRHYTEADAAEFEADGIPSRLCPGCIAHLLNPLESFAKAAERALDAGVSVGDMQDAIRYVRHRRIERRMGRQAIGDEFVQAYAMEIRGVKQIQLTRRNGEKLGILGSLVKNEDTEEAS